MTTIYTCLDCNTENLAEAMFRTNRRSPTGQCMACRRAFLRDYYVRKLSPVKAPTLTIGDMERKIAAINEEIAVHAEKIHNLKQELTLAEQVRDELIKAPKLIRNVHVPVPVPEQVTSNLPEQVERPLPSTSEEVKPTTTPTPTPKPLTEPKLVPTLSADGTPSDTTYPDVSNMFSPEAAAERKRRAELDAQDDGML